MTEPAQQRPLADMRKVGFIGLGIMGCPIAAHLLAAGHYLFLFNRSGVPAVLAEAGGVVCQSIADVAQKSDVVFLMLPDTPDVEAVLFDVDGLAAYLKGGSIVVDMSSISAMDTKSFANRIEALGCEYLDAPVSGGELGAKQATLTIMVGGKGSVFDEVKPLFQTMGKNISHVGGSGHGQICKIANQIIVALTIEAVGEALLFATKAGANPANVRQALMGGFASSRVLEVHGERMIKRTFEPGFRVRLHQKDLGLALAGARSLGLSLPNTATCQELFNACVAMGGEALDHSSMVKVLEHLAGVEIRETPSGH